MTSWGPGTKPRRPETPEEELARLQREDFDEARWAWLEEIGSTLADFDHATSYAYHSRNRITVDQIAEIMGWRGRLSLERAWLTAEIHRAVNRRSPDPFEGIVPDPAEVEFLALLGALGIRKDR